MACERINVLNVPLDICPVSDLEPVILELLQKPGPKQLLFLSVWDLLRAKRKGDFADCVRNADLVLPISKSLLRGAAFLKQTAPVRHNPFSAVVSILTILEAHYKSLYLFGGKKKVLMEANRNVHATYPNLQIVGRYVGYYPRSVEPGIIAAIRKASPSVVLLCDGVPEKVSWAYKRREQFSSSVFIYYPEALGIFSKTKKRISEQAFERGLEVWTEVIRNPFKIFRIFPYIYYNLLLVIYRIFALNR